MAALKTRVRIALTPDDTDGEVEERIIRMDRACFPGDYRTSTKDTWWWIVTVEGWDVGYAGMKYLPIDDCGYFSRAGVVEASRGFGFHKRLIKARIAYAKRKGWSGVLTYVAIHNHASLNALIGRGFRIYNPHYAWAGREGYHYLQLLF